VSEPAFLPLAVNVAVMDSGNRVLLPRREDFEVWCLPGGGVDHGESLAQAGVREVAEETGLAVRMTRLIGVYSYPNLGDYHTLALFGAVVTGGTLRPDPREVVEARWFSNSELPEDLLWGQRERLTDVFAGYGGAIVRATDRERPEIWPLSRHEHYALRDDSGLGRAEFYSRLVTVLGDGPSPIEVDGIRTTPFGGAGCE